ncbi:MAG: class A beta-lactamase-related serine hydrolase [Acidobacteria bacterium]|nr:MAG: class A beta-lactamase-related serine hydrolase [Acidobacteriota bacterium]REK10554.1 MAG: class A beta-lactamase-related serine hydrolase [Acidobacteriota bacterium]
MSRSIQLRGAASLLLSTTALVGFLTAGAALATNTAAVDAQALTTVEPEEVGLSSERLARIDARMQEYLEREEMAGALGLIARRGEVAYFETWGEADRESGVPMTEDTIFRIYSMTKPITAVAVMMLYEEGKFFLNDPIGKYIPQLADLEVMTLTADGEGEEGATRKPKGPVTIKQLLNFTAGFTYGIFGNTPVDAMYRNAGILFADRDLEHFVTKLGEIPLQFEPGTRWHYSVAIDVLGRLVEVTSGMPFDEFLKQRLFAPLGMDDTDFWVPEEKLDRFAQLYRPVGAADGPEAFLQANDSKAIEPAPAMTSRGFLSRPGAPSGGGGLVSTAGDYLRFCQMLLNGGELDGVRILSPKSVELMSRNSLGDVPMGMGRSGYGFGLGVAVAMDQGDIGELGSDGEYNWGGAAGTRFWIDPEEELIGIFMVQILPHRTTQGSDFRQLTYQAIVD